MSYLAGFSWEATAVLVIAFTLFLPWPLLSPSFLQRKTVSVNQGFISLPLWLSLLLFPKNPCVIFLLVIQLPEIISLKQRFLLLHVYAHYSLLSVSFAALRIVGRETIHYGRVSVVEGDAEFMVTGSRERRDWDSQVPFEGMLPMTQRSLPTLHLLASPNWKKTFNIQSLLAVWCGRSRL